MLAKHSESSESQSLLSPHRAVLVNSMLPPLESSTSTRTCLKYLLSRYTCKLSKAALVIILINVVVSACYSGVLNMMMEMGSINHAVGKAVITIYSFNAVVALFYPVSGYLADVCYGRYKVTLVGVASMFGSYMIFAFCGIIILVFGPFFWHLFHHNLGLTFFAYILIVITLFIFIIGLAGYQANFIQFGLDQLLEAPSTSLALFIHLVIWADSLGTFMIQVVSALFICEYHSQISFSIIASVSILLMLSLLAVLLCLRYCHFYIEPRLHNPYKMVFKILDFAKKHKFPVQRSAFTYTGDEEPSRLDFAKERYGGPFTTEQVEDVKTFLRILLLFVSLGSVFVLDIPTSYFISLSFGIHIIEDHSTVMGQTCSASFILLDKGSLTNLISVLTIPVYIWIVFSCFRRCMPTIFSRLIFAVFLYLLSVVSMLCIDLAGHLITKMNAMDKSSMCIYASKSHPPLLHLHWAVLLLPTLLIGVGQPLVIATAFEFISAQSPSSMKGLLIGVFFSIRAFFQLISGIALMPFSYKPLWDSQYMREHPPVTNCGFGYLLFTCIVALIGLVLLSVVARKYKYRERDDRPFDHRFAVDVYGRYLAEGALQDGAD